MVKNTHILLLALLATLICQAKFTSTEEVEVSDATEVSTAPTTAPTTVPTTAPTTAPTTTPTTAPTTPAPTSVKPKTPWYNEFSCTSTEHWVWSNVETFEGACVSNSIIEGCVAYENYHGKCIMCIKNYSLQSHKAGITCQCIYTNNIVIAVCLIILLIIGLMVMRAFQRSREIPDDFDKPRQPLVQVEARLISPSLQNRLNENMTNKAHKIVDGVRNTIQTRKNKKSEDQEEKDFSNMQLGEPEQQIQTGKKHESDNREKDTIVEKKATHF